MNYKVNYYYDDKEQIAGLKPHNTAYDTLDDYVSAETDDEALALAMQYVFDCITENNQNVEMNDDEIVVCDDAGVEIERYYGFHVREEIPTIKEIRTHTGLTQAAFSEKFLIPKRTLEDWEGGRRECAIYIRYMLAQICGMIEE